jgi:hypothetical protein
MAQNFKILGQIDLTSTSLENVYTVPTDRETVISTIVIANRTATATDFTIALRDAGATVANKHYLAFGVPIGGQDSTTITLGITAEATDVLSVSAGTANALSVNVFGTELTG